MARQRYSSSNRYVYYLFLIICGALFVGGLCYFIPHIQKEQLLRREGDYVREIILPVGLWLCLLFCYLASTIIVRRKLYELTFTDEGFILKFNELFCVEPWTGIKEVNWSGLPVGTTVELAFLFLSNGWGYSNASRCQIVKQDGSVVELPSKYFLFQTLFRVYSLFALFGIKQKVTEDGLPVSMQGSPSGTTMQTDSEGGNEILRYLKSRYPQGLAYEEAIGLCVAMYCVGNVFSDPALDAVKFTREAISEAISALYRDDMIHSYELTLARWYGANFHAPEDKGHWLEAMSSVLKLGRDYDREILSRLVERNKQREE